MRVSHMFVVAAAALAVPFAAFACEGHDDQQVKFVPLKEARELQQTKKATFVDANGKETRQKFGVIPGATLLTSSKDFDPAKVLPGAKDAKLVFYCANEKCTASHVAAKKATAAGYSDVRVLEEGIKGWKASGAPTNAPQS